MWKKFKSIFNKSQNQFSDFVDISQNDISESDDVSRLYSEKDSERALEDEKGITCPTYGLALADAIAAIIFHHGLDFMRSDKSTNALADYGAFVHNRAMLSIYRTMEKDGTLVKLWDLSSSDNIYNLIGSYKHQLVVNYGFNDRLVGSVLWEIVLGIGLICETEAKANINNLNQEGKNISQNEVLLSERTTYLYNSDEYTLPSVDILSSSKIDIDYENILNEGKNRIEWVLESQGIPVKGLVAYTGPRVSLYEVSTDIRKISRISRLEKVILSSLSSTGSRIINPLPDKLAVGIEVPNLDGCCTLSQKEIFDNDVFLKCDYELPIALGLDSCGNNIIRDLSKLPHLLICGEMQQGKTTLLRQIVVSILMRKRPEDVKFTFIDTCSLDFQVFKKLDAYWMAQNENDGTEPEIYDTQNGMKVLHNLLIEMECRIEFFQDAGVGNLIDYNNLFSKRNLDINKGHRPLPYIVVLCDEFVPLQTTDPKTFDYLISSLLPKAAMVGIHCVFTTK